MKQAVWAVAPSLRSSSSSRSVRRAARGPRGSRSTLNPQGALPADQTLNHEPAVQQTLNPESAAQPTLNSMCVAPPQQPIQLDDSTAPVSSQGVLAQGNNSPALLLHPNTINSSNDDTAANADTAVSLDVDSVQRPAKRARFSSIPLASSRTTMTAAQPAAQAATAAAAAAVATAAAGGASTTSFEWVLCDYCNKWRRLPPGFMVGR